MKFREVPSTVRIAAKRLFLFSLFLLLTLALASSASAQKKKKKDDASSNPAPAAMLPDEQRIDNAIGQTPGAWQLGDIEKLHSHYADDVDVVNGMWAPPVVGWPNYLVSYPSQRAPAQQGRLDRRFASTAAPRSSALRLAAPWPGLRISGNLRRWWMESRRQPSDIPR